MGILATRALNPQPPLKRPSFEELPLSEPLTKILHSARRACKHLDERAILRGYCNLDLHSEDDVRDSLENILRASAGNYRLETVKFENELQFSPDEPWLGDEPEERFLSAIQGIKGDWKAASYEVENDFGQREVGTLFYCPSRGMAYRAARSTLDLEALTQEAARIHGVKLSKPEDKRPESKKNKVATQSAATAGPGSTVIKYFDLIDEFIQVGADSKAIRQAVGTADRAADYKKLLVRAAIPDLDSAFDSVAALGEDYDHDIVIELLYGIVIDVNPELEIHQATLQHGAQGEEPGGALQVAPSMLEWRKRGEGLEEYLNARVIGQGEAVKAMVRAVNHAGTPLLRIKKGPVVTALFMGKTGTGKTELSKVLSEKLFGDDALIRVNCGEYQLPHEYAKLIGSPPGYIGHNEGGYLTEAVKKKPHAVILFDEVEKAHFKVHNLLLQLLDEGKITDSKGQVIDCSNTLVILTSNLGVDALAERASRLGFNKSQPLTAEERAETLSESIENFYRAEFINRLDEKVFFSDLNHSDCAAIAKLRLREIKDAFAKEGMTVTIERGVAKHLGEIGHDPDYSA